VVRCDIDVTVSSVTVIKGVDESRRRSWLASVGRQCCQLTGSRLRHARHWRSDADGRGAAARDRGDGDGGGGRLRAVPGRLLPQDVPLQVLVLGGVLDDQARRQVVDVPVLLQATRRPSLLRVVHHLHDHDQQHLAGNHKTSSPATTDAGAT